MVPDQSWQQALLTQGLLLAGALARYAVAWLASRTRKLEDETGEE
jgi:hypothetical protein